jgi:hypothetical protein
VHRLLTFLLVMTASCFAQFDPDGAQVISYFPHLADGGPSSQAWITSLTFVNPHGTLPSAGTVYLHADDGSPLTLDFGSGPVSSVPFIIPPQGTITLKSRGASSSILTGWAIAFSTLPIEGVVQFSFSTNGVPQQGVSAQSTPASRSFLSPATFSTGIAIANVYSDVSLPVTVSAIDANGSQVASTSTTIPPSGHKAFNVYSIFPSIAQSFRGTILITSSLLDATFVAWTLSADSGVLSSYPPSGLGWPVSQYERIHKVWQKILNAVPAAYIPPVLPNLVIDYSTGQINAFANPALNEVDIFLSLAELISDSESELGFVVGHELGHIIQANYGSVWVPSNKEYDADQWGMALSLLAGYDPYGGAGALAKLAMASGDAGLVSQTFDNLNQVVGVDLHGSFDNRIALVFQNMQQICASPQYATFCANYKSLIHPHLPPSAPLARPQSPSRTTQH